MATKKKRSLRREKTLRFVYRLVFTLVAFIAPLVIVSIKYSLFTKVSGYKLTVVGMIMLVVILWRFKSKIFEWVKTWEYSAMKHIIIGFSRVYLFIVVVVLLMMARKGLENIIFCIQWIAVCEIIAYLIIYPIEQKYDYNVKRLIRKKERKEDFKEAMNEMEEED